MSDASLPSLLEQGETKGATIYTNSRVIQSPQNPDTQSSASRPDAQTDSSIRKKSLDDKNAIPQSISKKKTYDSYHISSSNNSINNSYISDLAHEYSYPMQRSMSDGDLSDYFKESNEFISSLAIAKQNCNADIKLIMLELNNIVESSLIYSNVPVVGGSRTKHKRSASEYDYLVLKKVLDPDSFDSLDSSPIDASTSSTRKSVVSYDNNPSLNKITLASATENSVPSTLQVAMTDLISLAQDILDLEIDRLTQEGVCKSILLKILNLKEIWDSQPDWPCHSLLLRFLLSFASISRLVEHSDVNVKIWQYMNSKKDLKPTLLETRRQSQTPSDSPGKLIFRLDSEFGVSDTSDIDDFDNLSITSSFDAYSRKSSFNSTKKFKKHSRVQVFNNPDLKHPRRASFNYARYVNAPSLMNFKSTIDESPTSNILMEMSLQGAMLYVSPTIEAVLGYDPKECVSPMTPSDSAPGSSSDRVRNSISNTNFLPPGCVDCSVFGDATASLLNDGKSSVEVTYKARRKDGRWMEMEGKGMLMYDRISGEKVSTIWLITSTDVIGDGWDDLKNDTEFTGLDFEDNELESENNSFALDDVKMADSKDVESLDSSVSKSSSGIHQDLVLCRICERLIPSSLFETHNKLCLEVHQKEMNIQLTSDSLKERRKECVDKISILETEFNLERTDMVQNLMNRRLSTDSGHVSYNSQRRYLSFIEKLISLSQMILTAIDESLSLVVPEYNQRAADISDLKLNMIQSSEISNSSLWKCPPLSDFELPTVSNCSQNSPISPSADNDQIDDAVMNLGSGLYQIGMDVSARQYNLCKLAAEIVEYQSIIMQEEEIKMSIAAEFVSDDPIKTDSGTREDHISHSLSETEIPKKISSDLFTGEISDNHSESLFNSAVNISNGTSASLVSDRESEDLDSDSRFASRSPKQTSSPMSIKRSSSTGRNHTLLRHHISAADLGDPEIQSSISSLDKSPARARKSRPPRVIVSTNRSLDVEMKPGSLSNPQSGSIGHSPVTYSFLNTPLGFPSPTSPTSNQTPLENSVVGSFGSASSLNLATRTTPSIKDFEIIKPISKGAFGSVFLAKKRLTGDYFAIKVLRKSDMIAKNQVMNVKAERMILGQIDSPFVVMEYLNGGDCAALMKAVGHLDEKWAKQYISEVVLGLEFLHSKGIVHRCPNTYFSDIKPDNLLIDQNGHLKLTDFGLSRIGFLGRRAKGGMLDSWAQIAKSDSSSSLLSKNTSSTPDISPGEISVPMPVKNEIFPDQMETNTSKFSAVTVINRGHSRQHSTGSTISNDGAPVLGIRLAEHNEPETREKGFVGTPDYLAPESILGLGQGTSVDWWAVGVILYEFLFGIPPFNASTAQEVFERILAGVIDWHDGDQEFDASEHAKDLMRKLMCKSIEQRLGQNGAVQVKAHHFFDGIDWNSIQSTETSFVPNPDNEEDTEYFDDRGASTKAILTEIEAIRPTSSESPAEGLSNGQNSSEIEEKADFGEFSYRNLSLLEKANNDLLQVLKTSSHHRRKSTLSGIPSMGFSEIDTGNKSTNVNIPMNILSKKSPVNEDQNINRALKPKGGIFDESSRRNSLPLRIRQPEDSISVRARNNVLEKASMGKSRHSVVDDGYMPFLHIPPPSPTGITPADGAEYLKSAKEALRSQQVRNFSISGSPKPTSPSSPKLTSPLLVKPTSPKISPKTAKLSKMFSDRDLELDKRENRGRDPTERGENTVTRSDLLSYSITDELAKLKSVDIKSRRTSDASSITSQAPRNSNMQRSLSAAKFASPDLRNNYDRPKTVLVADDNPLACRVLETILSRINVKTTTVRNGAEVIRAAMGTTKYDMILMDILDGDAAARMISSADNINRSTPIIAVTAYEEVIQNVENFCEILSKPVTRERIFWVMKKYGVV